MSKAEFIFKFAKYLYFGLMILIYTAALFGMGYFAARSGFRIPDLEDKINSQSVSFYPQDTQTNVSEFLSSPFLLPFSPVLAGTRNVVDNISFSNMQFKFFSDGSIFNLSYKIAGSYLHVEGNSINNAFSFDDLSWSSFAVSNDGQWHDQVLKSWSGYPLDNTYEFKITYRCVSSFISNVSYVVISPLTDLFGAGVSGVDLYFVDVNGNGFSFDLLGPSGIYKNTFLDYVPSRTVYFISDLTNNDYYNAGFSAGIQQGLADNQQYIYNAGFSAGEYQGDSNGYQRGLRDANQYTFLSLAGAVVDAPIKAAMGLLNFNFLGFNLWNLATGILSFAAVVKIVKLVLGGR